MNSERHEHEFSWTRTCSMNVMNMNFLDTNMLNECHEHDLY